MAPVVFRAMSFPDFVVYMYNKLKGHKYGGVYQFMTPIVLLRDPELIKMVTVKDFEYFLDRQFLISEDVEPMFGKALFFLKGEQFTACIVSLLPLNLLHVLYLYCHSRDARVFQKHSGLTGQYKN